MTVTVYRLAVHGWERGTTMENRGNITMEIERETTMVKLSASIFHYFIKSQANLFHFYPGDILGGSTL